MARYGGNTAVDYRYRSAIPQPELQPERNFEVLEGTGLDERARRGVSATQVQGIKLFAVAFSVVLSFGVARIALSAATVTAVETALEMRSEISDAQASNNELRVENSILSSATRIERIATQNYGMEYANETATISIDEQSSEESTDTSSEESEVEESSDESAA